MPRATQSTRQCEGCGCTCTLDKFGEYCCRGNLCDKCRNDPVHGARLRITCTFCNQPAPVTDFGSENMKSRRTRNNMCARCWEKPELCSRRRMSCSACGAFHVLELFAPASKLCTPCKDKKAAKRANARSGAEHSGASASSPGDTSYSPMSYTATEPSPGSASTDQTLTPISIFSTDSEDTWDTLDTPPNQDELLRAFLTNDRAAQDYLSRIRQESERQLEQGMVGVEYVEEIASGMVATQALSNNFGVAQRHNFDFITSPTFTLADLTVEDLKYAHPDEPIIGFDDFFDNSPETSSEVYLTGALAVASPQQEESSTSTSTTSMLSSLFRFTPSNQPSPPSPQAGGAPGGGAGAHPPPPPPAAAPSMAPPPPPAAASSMAPQPRPKLVYDEVKLDAVHSQSEALDDLSSAQNHNIVQQQQQQLQQKKLEEQPQSQGFVQRFMGSIFGPRARKSSVEVVAPANESANMDMDVAEEEDDDDNEDRHHRHDSIAERAKAPTIAVSKERRSKNSDVDVHRARGASSSAPKQEAERKSAAPAPKKKMMLASKPAAAPAPAAPAPARASAAAPSSSSSSGISAPTSTLSAKREASIKQSPAESLAEQQKEKQVQPPAAPEAEHRARMLVQQLLAFHARLLQIKRGPPGTEMAAKTPLLEAAMINLSKLNLRP